MLLQHAACDVPTSVGMNRMPKKELYFFIPTSSSVLLQIMSPGMSVMQRHINTGTRGTST